MVNLTFVERNCKLEQIKINTCNRPLMTQVVNFNKSNKRIDTKWQKVFSPPFGLKNIAKSCKRKELKLNFAGREILVSLFFPENFIKKNNDIKKLFKIYVSTEGGEKTFCRHCKTKTKVEMVQ
jgi:hypothetical protein